LGAWRFMHFDQHGKYTQSPRIYINFESGYNEKQVNRVYRMIYGMVRDAFTAS
jgi:hypothetical protein